MEDILNSVSRGETLNVTSDDFNVERDLRSRLLNAYGSPINARGTEQNRTDEIYLHCAKELRCTRNIGFEEYFQSDLFRSVDTFRGAPGMIREVQKFISQATVVLKL